MESAIVPGIYDPDVGRRRSARVHRGRLRDDAAAGRRRRAAGRDLERRESRRAAASCTSSAVAPPAEDAGGRDVSFRTAANVTCRKAFWSEYGVSGVDALSDAGRDAIRDARPRDLSARMLRRADRPRRRGHRDARACRTRRKKDRGGGFSCGRRLPRGRSARRRQRAPSCSGSITPIRIIRHSRRSTTSITRGRSSRTSSCRSSNGRAVPISRRGACARIDRRFRSEEED